MMCPKTAVTVCEAVQLSGKLESFKVKKKKKKSKKPDIKVFDAPSTFFSFADRKANRK